MIWFIDENGLIGRKIDRCRMRFTAYYPTNRRHDVDNSVPKFILDGMTESKFIVDDDMNHVTEITLRCAIDPKNPRTEIEVFLQ